MMILFPIVLCALAVVGLLVAERAGSRSGVWLVKPIAAGAFVASALAWGALETNYGRWILTALVLCSLGDLLLIPKESRSWFRAGIVAFLSGHLAFIGAFLQLSRGRLGLMLGVASAAVLAWVVASWLGPRLPASFRRLVGLYVVVICAMLVAAFAAAAGTGVWSLAVGSAMFAVSDLAVARDRFVEKSFANRLWGLPLYFAAQLVLASTVASCA